jgi:endogenous inhibitor of DNA gyrase (YacG/DUF329 family)
MRTIAPRHSSVVLNCDECGQSFTRYASMYKPDRLQFCSTRCRDAHAKGKPNPRNGRVSCKCTQCGITFSKQRHRLGKRNFCSEACHHAYGSLPCTCTCCGAIVQVQKRKVPKGDEYFCSQKCLWDWQGQIIETVASAYRERGELLPFGNCQL